MGKNYNRNNPKVLVLSESTYATEQYLNKAKEDHTAGMIRALIEENPDSKPWRHPYYTKLYRLFCSDIVGSPYNKFTILDFWNSISFYHYVQMSVGEKARIRPSPEHWKDATVPYSEVLSILKPDLVFVMGIVLFRNIPKENITIMKRVQVQLAKKTVTVEFGKYEKDNVRCHLVQLKHPSSGFAYEPWRKVVSEAFKSNFLT